MSKKTLFRLLKYLYSFKISIIVVIIFSIISTVFVILGPKILALITDELALGVLKMAEGQSATINFGYIGTIALILLALYLVSVLFSYIQGYLMAGVATKVSYNLRNALIEKINKLPLEYFHKKPKGEMISRIINDVDVLEQNLSQSVIQLITSVASIIGIIIMMASINLKLTLIIICVIPVSFGFLLILVKLSQKHFLNHQNYLGIVTGQVEEMYSGHVVLKAFNGEKKALENFDKENEKLYESSWKSQFLSGIMFPIVNFISNLGYVVISVVGATMVAGGTLSIGGVQAFLQYVRSFSQPIILLSNMSSQFQQMVASAERIFELLDEEEEKVKKVSIDINDVDIKGNIKFDNIKFGYREDKLVIKGFSADIKAGQKVAIVGPTGAGKTTIVKLLMRFYNVKEGAIYLEGHNIEDFERLELRRKFGMVLQESWLYNNTIMENIRYGKLDAKDEEVIEAAKLAQVDHFIRTLPGGYNMELNEDTDNISQGQKQLLTIARAILADSKVLILDEATSSVDTRTEILIQDAMDNLMKGRTSFIIAHRLSTIKNADLILCMNHGDIVEQGTHNELIAKKGFYANLYNSQFYEGEDIF